MKLIIFSIIFAIAFIPFALAQETIERESWINLRGDEVNVFPSSVEKLLMRGYFEQKTIGDITYSGKVDLDNLTYHPDALSITLQISNTGNEPSPLLITIPRDVIDVRDPLKSDYGFYSDEFFVLTKHHDENLIEILYDELPHTHTHRTILFDVNPETTEIEIIGACFQVSCDIMIDS